ncbi:MAG: hypothetical protein ACRDSJ_03260 [Rubrobacteraceae bacterium]
MRLFLTTVLSLVCFASCGAEAVSTLDAPEVRRAPEAFAAPDGAARDEDTETRIGSFEPPEDPPPYEILEEKENRRDGVRGARLLVDTPVKSEEAYELMARDLKARYKDYDAVSAEITDTGTGSFGYEGAILIFNTPEGSYYMGFFYSPPNNRGYIVDVAD